MWRAEGLGFRFYKGSKWLPLKGHMGLCIYTYYVYLYVWGCKGKEKGFKGYVHGVYVGVG